ncbi:MAG: hypothetical protein LC776_09360 [Acidobacteria bacterium]|nr:hypothetical protein [Acidobacteriota bacterium]
MTKRSITWPYDNTQYQAWQVESAAGHLVVRRNHPPQERQGQQCHGLDVWLDGKFLGAIGSRSISDLGTLSHQALTAATFPACCGKHKEFSFGQRPKSRSNWGGRRAGAGRRRIGDACRVRISAMLDPRTVALLDELRGNSSRSQFLEQLIQSQSARQSVA